MYHTALNTFPGKNRTSSWMYYLSIHTTIWTSQIVLLTRWSQIWNTWRISADVFHNIMNHHQTGKWYSKIAERWIPNGRYNKPSWKRSLASAHIQICFLHQQYNSPFSGWHKNEPGAFSSSINNEFCSSARHAFCREGLRSARSLDLGMNLEVMDASPPMGFIISYFLRWSTLHFGYTWIVGKDTVVGLLIIG